MAAPGVDRGAAARATAVAAAVVALLVVAQTAVGAAATAGRQPMAVREAVPAAADTDADAWTGAPSRTLDLSPQRMALPHGGGSVGELRVEAVTNESHVAVRLTWPDPTRDTSIAAPTAYSDAVALMLHGGETPPITMGATGTPVNIWYWRASWQFGAHAGTGSSTGSMYAYPHPDAETKPGLAVGNPLSKSSYARYAQNYYARGYGSLSHAPAQNVNASGARTGDGWQVAFARERSTNGTYDAAFDEAERMYLTVAVWNGSAGEANGQKALSYRFLRLDTRTGDLAAAEGDDGGEAGDGGEAPPAGAPSDGEEGIGDEFWGLTWRILAVVVVSWLLAYRSLRGDAE